MKEKLATDEIVALVKVLWVSEWFGRAWLRTLEGYRGDTPKLFTVATHSFFGNPVFSRSKVQLLRGYQSLADGRLADRIVAFNHRLLLVEDEGQQYLEDEFFPKDCAEEWRGFELVDGRIKWEGVHEFLRGLRSNEVP